MTCYLTLSDHPPLILEIGMFAPTADRQQLVDLLVGRLESCRLKSSVKQITLSVTLSDRLQTAQPLLFQSGFQSGSGANSSSVANHSSLPRLINSLSGRLGRDAVLQVLPSDDPLPEKAFRLSPLTGQQKPGQQKLQRKRPRKSTPENSSRHFRGHSVSSLHPTRDDALRRPLTLLPNPLPLTAVGPLPLTAVGPLPLTAVGPLPLTAVGPLPLTTVGPTSSPSSLPAGFHLGGRLHRVVRCWGPERIETGWWNGPSIRRDYYRVEMDSGGWWWVYRRLGKTPSNSQLHSPAATHQASVRTVVAWMLHGRFS